MISEEEALASILEAVSPSETQHVRLLEAIDLFAARDLTATVRLPPFDNSAMDGYAVSAGSAEKGARLKVIGDQPAGVSRNLRIAAGEAVRIFTGAPIPAGADAVVMQEDTRRDGGYVWIDSEEMSAGDFIRMAGCDLARGQQIMGRGERLRPASIALLASQGLKDVEVHSRPSVSILTTGDEIVDSGEHLRPGQIFESNGVMLAALTQQTRATIRSQSHCADTMADLRVALEEGMQRDVLIISGGVSVGEHDLVRRALNDLGAVINLWRVSIKPGKPFLFGKRDTCTIFGLPGNPVSSFITFLVFVRPALLRMMGARNDQLSLPVVRASLREALTADQSRPHYVRGRLDDRQFTAIGRQESHALFGLSRANSLVRIGPGESLQPGSEVTALLIP